MASQFARMFHQSVAPVLWQLHAVPALLRVSPSDVVWRQMLVKPDMSQAKLAEWRKPNGSVAYARMDFLFPASQLAIGVDGRRVLPNERSVLEWDASLFIAAAIDGNACLTTEDDERQIWRLITTEHQQVSS